MKLIGRSIAALLVCLSLFCTGCAEQKTLTVLPEPQESAAATKSVDASGSYSGSWEMFNCSGTWAEFDRFSWECWAELDGDELLIWDEDVPKDIGLARLELCKTDGGYEIKAGRFMDISAGFEGWSLLLDENGSITIRGCYDGNAPGSFSFAMYLEKEKA